MSIKTKSKLLCILLNIIIGIVNSLKLIIYLTDEEKAGYEDRIKSNKEEENIIEDKIKNCKKRIKTDKEDIKKLKNMKVN